MSQSEGHLKAGQLGTADVTASTVANIGPGIDFSFGFGVIAVTAGVAAPLTILAATLEPSRPLCGVLDHGPFVELCQPGQPAPYSAFPFIALAIGAVAAVIASVVVRRHPRTGSSEGAAFPGS